MSFFLGVSSRLSLVGPGIRFISFVRSGRTIGSRRVLFRNKHLLPLIGMRWSFEEQRGSPPRVHGHDQIQSHQSSLRSLWASPSFCSRLPLVHPPHPHPHPHAPSTFRSSILSLLSLISSPCSSFTHTPHTHTRSTLHSTHPHGDTSSNLDLTSPHLSSTSTNAAVLLSQLDSTSSNRLPSPPWVSPRNTTRRLLSINSLSTLGSLGSAEQHKLSVHRHRRLSCSLDRHHIDR